MIHSKLPLSFIPGAPGSRVTKGYHQISFYNPATYLVFRSTVIAGFQKKLGLTFFHSDCSVVSLQYGRAQEAGDLIVVSLLS
jgi:hypothetical protein